METIQPLNSNFNTADVFNISGARFKHLIYIGQAPHYFATQTVAVQVCIEDSSTSIESLILGAGITDPQLYNFIHIC